MRLFTMFGLKAFKMLGYEGIQNASAPPGWLSGERVRLVTSAEACEKSSWWLWKEKLCWYWCEKARKHICVTDRHDMTLAVKMALNPQYNQ